MFARSRFARSRVMQVVAWLVAFFCLGVIITGVIVGNEKLTMAQDAGVVADAGSTAAQVPPAQDGAPPAQPETTTNDGGGNDVGGTTNAGATNNKPMFTRQVGKGEKSGVLDRAMSFFGIFVLIGMAVGLSNNRKKINWKLVGWGVALQLAFAIVIFFVPGGEAVFDLATKAVDKLLGFTNDGSTFIFQSFITNKMEPPLINFAFAVLPTIIFFSSLMTILYHMGVMQKIVYGVAWVMQRTMHTSGAESLSAAANIFVGQTEAPLVIKPYCDKMTMSELMTVMTGGFATVAGGVMAIYVGMLKDVFPDIAGHLIAASVMSAPAALVIGKIMYPETEVPETSGDLDMDASSPDTNILDAASRGAAEGLTLALNVAAMLLAFIALISLINFLIALPFEALKSWFDIVIFDKPLTLQTICSYLFAPIAWIMGVPMDDCLLIGRLLGVKMVVNELVAYAELQVMLKDAAIHLQDRSVIIATYALCGFANFGSIGIQLGGIGGIAPNRKHDLAKIALRAMIAGTIAAFMTATIAGILV